MRSINLETGRAYPRKRPVDWAAVRRILAYRRERSAMTKAGYIEREILQGGYSDYNGRRIVDAIPSADGRRVFVKVVDQTGVTVRDLTPAVPNIQERANAGSQQSRPLSSLELAAIYRM